MNLKKGAKFLIFAGLEEEIRNWSSMKHSEAHVAGVLVFVANVEFIVAMTVAEAFYPGYSISQNYISDLGATCRATCQVLQPTATIFNSSIILLGLMIIVGSYFVRLTFRSVVLPVFVALTGIGALGVGVFPETAGFIHHIVSLITFIFAGLSAMATVRVVKAPMTFFSLALGVMTLGALALYASGIFLGLGPGGMERMIVYPALAWGTGFGAYLMAPSRR